MSSTDLPKASWDESDSRDFLDLGRFFVPEREEQLAAFCALVPPCCPGSQIVELCCGEGLLAGALLAHFPQATVHGYDDSGAMLARAGAALASHGARFQAHRFDLADRGWRRLPGVPAPPIAVVSSLAVHHLDGAGKRELYADLFAALAPGGALLIADLVRPTSAAGVELAARAWDEAVKRRVAAAGGRSDERTGEPAGDRAPWERFRRERWNYFADPDPDPMDKPSGLLEQLRWLEEAGFGGADVFWMKAGHALFGGWKPE